MSVNKAKPRTTTTSTQTSQPISLQDVEGVSIVGNNAPVTITDAGAIEGSLGLAGNVVERAAELTLALVSRQADAGKAALSAAQDAATQGYNFAMDAGRSDVKAVQNSNKIILYVVAIAAAAFVMQKWAK